MNQKEEVKKRLEQIILHCCAGKRSEFARRIGTSIATINSWYHRGNINAGVVLSAFPGINPQYLTLESDIMFRPGEEPEHLKRIAEPRPYSTPLDDSISILSEQLASKDAQIQSLQATVNSLVEQLAAMSSNIATLNAAIQHLISNR